MIYPTPSKEFDGVTTGLRLLEAAVDLIALCDEQPEKRAEYLQEAANLIKDAWLAVQTAAGRAIEAEAERKEQQGYRLCIRCDQWKPEVETMRIASRQEEKRDGFANHWTECLSCLGLSAPQTHQDDNADPFEQDGLL